MRSHMKSYIHKYNVYNEVLKKIPTPQQPPVFKTSGKLNICLIEYRPMNEILYVLNALLRVYKACDIGLTIVCGNKNESFVRNCVSSWDNVNIINTGHDNLNRQTYSSLLKMPTFWEYFTEWSHVLIYQTDALIMRKIDDVYFQYDYIGAPWDRKNQWVKHCAGNGGFSLRRVQAMIDACECHRNIPQGKICGSNEDGFFCDLDTLIFPPINSMMHHAFAVEQVFHPSPIGCHQVYRYLNNTHFKKLLQYIIVKLC